MRIVVDRTRCQGMGVCESILPQIFEVEDDGVMMLHTELAPPGTEADVQLAVDSCPTQALSVKG